MKKLIHILFFALASNIAFSQARLVIGNASPVYVVMNSNAVRGGNPIYLVIGSAAANSATNTITRNSGWIISEGENNIVKWFIGTNAGTYTVPWGYSTTDYLPLTLTTAGAPAAGKYINFSTYRTGNYQNSLYLPLTGTVPTNYYSGAIGGVADVYGVDRFWSLETDPAYTTKPDLNNLTFTYSSNEILIGTNTGITPESDLQAQRWSTTGSCWCGWINGVDVPASNYVQLSITAADFFKWWTLVDKSAPLPVEWLNISGQCNNNDMIIKWSTATEFNSSYFTLEKSLDGINFSAITTVPAAGNSNTIQNYSAVDNDAYSGTSYYHVRETDFNGEFTFSNNITVNGCSGDNIMIYEYDGVNVNINSDEDGQYAIEIYNVLGQKLLSETKNVTTGENNFNIPLDNISSSVYIVKVIGNNNIVTKKIVK